MEPKSTGVAILERVITYLEMRARIGLISAKDLAFSMRFLSNHMIRFATLENPITLVTEKEKAKLSDVLMKIARGDKDVLIGVASLPPMGGSRHLNKVERVEKVESPESFAKKNAFWKSGYSSNPDKPKTYRVGNYPNSPIKDLVEEFGPINPNPEILHCSYCSKKVERITATFGVRPLTSFQEVITSLDPLVIESKPKFSSISLVACPECALNIRPTLDRSGHYVSHNTKYEGDEG